MGLDSHLGRVERAVRPAGRDRSGPAWLETLSDDELATLEALVLAQESGEPLTAMQAAVLDGYQRRYAQYQARET